MARGRAQCVKNLNAKLFKVPCELSTEQQLRIVEKWAPPEELLAPERTLTIRFVRE